MNYKTHIIGGVATGLIATQVVLNNTTSTNTSSLIETGILSTAIFTGAIVGSVFPDIDKKNSFIGRRFKAVSTVFSFVFKHRGFIHTPILYIVLIPLLLQIPQNLIDGVFATYVYLTILGFTGGVLSHLLLDSMTEKGIMWLYPIKKKYFRLLRIKTGSSGEKFFSALLFIGVFSIIINIFM